MALEAVILVRPLSVWRLPGEVGHDGGFHLQDPGTRRLALPFLATPLTDSIPDVCPGLKPTHTHELFCVEKPSYKTPGIIEVAIELWLLVTVPCQECQR